MLPAVEHRFNKEHGVISGINQQFFPHPILHHDMGTFEILDKTPFQNTFWISVLPANQAEVIHLMLDIGVLLDGHILD